MPPEIKEMPGGKEALQKMLKEMGPVSVNEKKLLIISCLLLFFWVTEKNFIRLIRQQSPLQASC